jgi:hypothetical protein
MHFKVFTTAAFVAIFALTMITVSARNSVAGSNHATTPQAQWPRLEAGRSDDLGNRRR